MEDCCFLFEELESTTGTYKRINFIPKIIRKFLIESELQKAVDICQIFKARKDFGFVIESLLEDCFIDLETFGDKTSFNVCLRLLPKLFKEMDISEISIVNFLRKSDHNIWEKVFEVFGSPLFIFRNLLQRKSLTAAMNCLIVIKSFCSENPIDDIIELTKLVLQSEDSDFHVNFFLT